MPAPAGPDASQPASHTPADGLPAHGGKSAGSSRYDGGKEAAEGLVGGEWMCVFNFVPENSRETSPEEVPASAGEWEGPLPLYRRQLSSQPYQSPQAVRSFIHTSIQVPAPTTNPRDHVQNSSARPPNRPSVRCATFPSFTKIPHTLGLAPPVIPAPSNLCRLGGEGGAAIPNEYTIVDGLPLGVKAVARPAGAHRTAKIVPVNTSVTTVLRLI